LLCVAISGVYAHSSGPDPGYTGAPGDSPLACASAGCHTSSRNGGPVNAAGGSVTATFSGGANYTPGGQPITITVTVSDPVNKNFGFQMTARLGSDKANGQAGTFTPGSGTFVLCSNNSPRRTACPAGSPIEFIEHSQPSKIPWTFTWTPPATNAGDIYFYVAGNAVNSNGSADGGDHVYTNSFVLHPVICTTGKPAISSINSAGDFGGFSNFASGSWLEIKGSNLADSTRQCLGTDHFGCWEGPDFQGTTAPVSFDGAAVMVNGKPAAVSFVSPGQINIQAPEDPATGFVDIVVKNCSTPSDPFRMNKQATAPGLLAPAAFKAGGKQYVVAQLPNLTFIGNPGSIPGVTLVPAKPGDQLTIYGVGFGDVDPPNPPGAVTGALNTLVNPVTFALGSTTAAVNYQGLSPGYVGLYQFNIVVPEVPDGDQPLNVSQNGTPLPQSLYLPVKH
jgi:uncharacterized protein (TIGR03437 family)